MNTPLKYLTHQPIVPQDFINLSGLPGGAGGNVLFFGTVRGEALQRKVTHLFYEAYEPLADRLIDDLISKAVRIWPILGAKVQHRLGKVAVGEVAVAIEVAGGHRDEAYKASRFLIDQIKREVPIWKKEYFEDGIYRWGRCDHAARPKAAVFSLSEIKKMSPVSKNIKIFSPKKSDQASREPEYLNEMTG